MGLKKMQEKTVKEKFEFYFRYLSIDGAFFIFKLIWQFAQRRRIF